MLETDFSHAHFDQPASWHFTTEKVDIRGWVVAKDGSELSDIRAKLDGVVTYGILGLDRPDIERAMAWKRRQRGMRRQSLRFRER